MKKLLIGGLVGGLVLFFWQFLSWSLINIHASEMQYSPNQDEVLACLQGKLEPGNTYMMPNVPPGTPQADHQSSMNDYMGKPWAKISYRDNLNMDMGTNMFRGFVVNFLAALILTWLLMQFKELTMMKSILACLAVGAIGWLTVNYIDSIWFETKTIAALIDVAVCYSIMGAFLGWWINRN